MSKLFSAPRFTVAAAALAIACGAQAEPLRVVSPAADSVVRPGALVTVAVEAEPGVVPAWVVITVGGDDQRVSAAPYQATFTVPDVAAGQITVGATGRTAAGEWLRASSVQLRVIPAGTPDRLEAQMAGPLQIESGIGTRALIDVEGYYPDGKILSLSSAVAGTTYQTSDPAIATVDMNGWVQANSVGTAVITVLNGGKKAFVAAKVSGPGSADAIQDVTSSLQISAGAFRVDPGTQLVSQQVTLRNTANAPLLRPLYVVVSNLPQGVELRNGVGRTKVVTPLGSRLVRAKFEGDVLAPGASATATLTFVNLDGRQITHQLRVFTGEP